MQRRRQPPPTTGALSSNLPPARPRRNRSAIPTRLAGLFFLGAAALSRRFAEALSSIAAPLESRSLPAPAFLAQPPQLPQPSQDTIMSAAAADAFPHVTLSWERGVCDLILQKYRERRLSEGAAAATSSPCEGSPLPLPRQQPLMCAVVGIPGSGKTTSAAVLAEMLGASVRASEGGAPEGAGGGGALESAPGALMMPFDGFHIPLSALRKMGPDAVYRRGAPDTFDAAKLEQALREIRSGSAPALAIPGFDHARGDPDEGAHAFDRSRHKIVVVEGLYLLHDGDGWESIRDCFDFSVYVDADLDVCMERLKARNRCIPGYTPEEIDVRVDAVDRANALVVERSRARADLVVRSAAY